MKSKGEGNVKKKGERKLRGALKIKGGGEMQDRERKLRGALKIKGGGKMKDRKGGER